MDTVNSSNSLYDIAVIGMAGRFPGARSIDEFWRNLCDGVDAISSFSIEELTSYGIAQELLQDPNYVRAGGVIEDMELFDASFFGYTPKEASIMDPQHRIFLECAWTALEDAGYNTDTHNRVISVYGGCNLNSYLLFHVLPNPHIVASMGDYQAKITNDKDYLTTRVSYKLNLTGPSITIQTACSTSLVAVHLACQSLLQRESDIALAGGASITSPYKRGSLYREGMITSPDGRCRSFDINAQGTVASDGVGIVVLKRLADALEDGDHIYAVIKGSAINNDGALKVGYTAPSVDGQAAVIREALAMADVGPETISYVEAHGTGTRLGDPIEVAALTKAFRSSTEAKGFCAIGSVKSNIGHLDAAAGIAGFIKTVLALKHQMLPPSLHFEQPNPDIDFANSPFYVNSKLSDWRVAQGPRRAGVSSFGIGGTNAHVILEEAPTRHPSGPSKPWQLLMLSAKTSTALDTTTQNVTDYLKYFDCNLADVAYTLQLGRHAFEHRRVIVCEQQREETAQGIGFTTLGVYDQAQRVPNPSVIFMFSGQGSQYINMALDLYQTEHVFHKHIDQCAELFIPHLGLDLRTVLYPVEDQSQDATQQLAQTVLTQPALFTIEYALAQLYMAWGIQPQAMIGHSIGEYVAACLAGVFSLENAVMLVAQRGKMMNALPRGAMLAIMAQADTIGPRLGRALSLAAINAPGVCVASGSEEDISTLEQDLTSEGIHCRRLHTSHAFHSWMVDSMLEPFTMLMRRMKLAPPTIPFISNVSGNWITEKEATDPSYWARHLRQPVLFADGLGRVMADQGAILLEVGPGITLSQYAKQHADYTSKRVVLSSLPHPQDRVSDGLFFHTTLGKLWLAGVHIDWLGFYAHDRRQRVSLPTYPFERERYWIDPIAQTHQVAESAHALQRRAEVASWFYTPVWREAVLVEPLNLAASLHQKLHWLVFLHEQQLESQLLKQLEDYGQDVTTVIIGACFAKQSEHVFVLNPQEQSGYDSLFKELRLLNKIPDMILHGWTITAGRQADVFQAHVNEELYLGLYSLLFLMQAIGKYNANRSVHLSVLSNNVCAIESLDWINPTKATILGICKVIPLEYQHTTCQVIDVAFPETGTPYEQKVVGQLLREIVAKSSDHLVVYRGNRRWVQSYQQLPVHNIPPEETKLRAGGVYLITGGLGGIGLVLAQYLAQTVRAKLLLTGRSELPPRANWNHWREHHGDKDGISRKISHIQEIEAAGGEVLVLCADVTHLEAMQAVISQGIERFGAIHGIIHTAGIAGGGIIQLKTVDSAEQVLMPKIQGLTVLETLCKDLSLDFLFICSSLTSIIGAFGRADYCAANAFTDAFARYYTEKTGILTVAINWETWQDTGMAVNTEVSDDLAGLRDAMLSEGITSVEGSEVFRHILGINTLPQIAVSTTDLQLRIKAIGEITHSRQAQLSERVQSTRAIYPRPDLKVPYLAPSNEMERAIAALWQEALGIVQVGINDSFFELGGHSLLATQIIAQIHEVLQVDLPFAAFFEDPTVAALARVIELREAGITDEAATALPMIVPKPEERFSPFPLTDMQQAYWIGRSGMFDLGNVSIHLYVELESDFLDIDRFNRGWQQLIERHDMLRAIIRPDGQQQIMEHVPPYQIEVVDLRDQAPELAAKTIVSIRERLSHQVLPPDQWPLFEVRIARCEGQRLLLFISIDGLLADGRSYQILLQDLVKLYQSPETFPKPFTVSFRDYVMALNTFQNTDSYQNSLNYWRNRLSTIAPAPKLPLAQAPHLITRPHFVRREFSLPAEHWQRLKARAGQAGLTSTSLLLAIYAEVLTLWSESPHFTINVPRFNRLPLHSEINSLVGEFASYTLLEVNNSQADTFEARAQRIHGQLWKDLEHQFISGVQVIRELGRIQGQFTGAAMPIVFTSVFNLEMSVQPASMLDVLGKTVYAIAQTPQVWMDFMVGEQAGALVLHLDAVEELFPENLVDDMFVAYCRFIERLTFDEAAWRTSLGRLSLPAQISQGNATATPYPLHLCLHELIEQQVNATPDAIAVVLDTTQITYRALNQRANQLAHYLRAQAVGPETPVGLYMERSIDLLVGLLGILKAGACFVPLDPAYPRERLAFMLQDAHVAFVLTQQPVLASLPHQHAETLCLDTDWSQVAGFPTSTPDTQVLPDHLAYIIYTSGSTGTPKGAMNTHRGICNRLLWMQATYQLDASDCVLQKTPYSFDVSVWEFFWPLLCGARLLLARPGGHRDPRYLVELIEQHGVTTLHFVPSMLALFLNEPALAGCQSLRRVICSGEALSRDLHDRFFAQLEAELHNLYGPTEAAVDVSAWACRREHRGRSIPIGRPIANTQLYVLTAQLEPCPVWVAGELYIGGVGLARGYYERPALTAERFIPHPYSTEAGARLYRTGDRARYLPDGSIDYLERLDAQVKIRGVRIELGEIEVTLRRHAEVEEAVVVSQREESGEVRLVGYIVPRARHTLATEELRRFLLSVLPEAMIPAAFVFLAALPLTPNGKLDRRALPAPDSSRPDLKNTYVAPWTALEEVVAEVWREVLKLERVGVEDNFFTLGGHSLHLVQILSRLRQIFSIELQLYSLVEAVSVEAQARLIRSLDTTSGRADKIADILQRTRAMSPEEKTRLLEEKRREGRRGNVL